MFRPRFTGAALAGAVVLVLAIAPQAMAGRITYNVDPGSQYAVKDNGNGIVKLNYNGCVTAGARQTLRFVMTTTVTRDSAATFKVLKSEGQDPTLVFSPNPVKLVQGSEQSFDIALAFTLPSANNGVTTFRIKLDPSSGEGLGEGPGLMVRVPCVIAGAAQPATLAAEPAPTPAPAIGGAPAADVPPVAVVHSVVFPTIGSSLDRRPARGISMPRRLRVRARHTTRLSVRVHANGQNISGALVRLTLPGGVKLFRRTGSDGIARRFVRPSRSGTLVIQSAACLGAKRVKVLRARTAPPVRARFAG
jgi:hypothetical protein